MEDRRKEERFRAADYSKDETRYVKRYFKILDRTNDKSLGYMMDISSEGVMVLSKLFMKEDHIYKFRIELPEEIKGSDRLVIDARCVWCERDASSEFYRAGFAFVSAFPHHEEVIQLLFARGKERDAESYETISSSQQGET